MPSKKSNQSSRQAATVVGRLHGCTSWRAGGDAQNNCVGDSPLRASLVVFKLSIVNLIANSKSSYV